MSKLYDITYTDISEDINQLGGMHNNSRSRKKKPSYNQRLNKAKQEAENHRDNAKKETREAIQASNRC